MLRVRYALSSLSGSFRVLGLQPSARSGEVRKKYYELAKIYHPDLNNSDAEAQRRFAQITEAYKALMENIKDGPRETKESVKSTFYKRNTGERPNEKRQKPATEHEEYEPFYDVDSFFRKGRKGRKGRPGEDIYINTTISLRESLVGCKAHRISYTRRELCGGCRDKSFESCFTCGGKGVVYNRVQRAQERCGVCMGRGYDNGCVVCDKSGFVARDIEDSIVIEENTQDKTILKILNNGHNGYRMGNGDLYVTVFVEPSAEYRIDGNNVHGSHEVDYLVATIGGKTVVETLYGRREVVIGAGTQSGTEVRIMDAGLKSPYSNRRGDHVVKIRVRVPSRLSERERDLWRQLQGEE